MFPVWLAATSDLRKFVDVALPRTAVSDACLAIPFMPVLPCLVGLKLLS